MREFYSHEELRDVKLCLADRRNHHTRALKIYEEFNYKSNMAYTFNGIGFTYSDKGNYKEAIQYLEKSLSLQKEIGLFALDSSGFLIWTTTCLYFTYKNLGIEYDEKAIRELIKETQLINFDLNYRIYQLLEETSYLETSYNQI